MSIVIKTRLHDGIYASHGGGKTSIHYEWTTGPRNLMKAADILPRHAHEMEKGYGNIGHIASWIEIDGVRIHPYTIMDLDFSPAHRPEKTRTEVARQIIADTRSGNPEK